MAHDADFRRELGQQLRVDSVRASAAAGSGHPDLLDVRRRPDGRADRRPPAARLRQPAQPGQRPPDLLQGPRVAAVLLDPEGGRRDRRRGAADVPQARLAPGGPPDAAHPADRRRHRLARPGPADRRRRRRWPAASLDQLPVPRVGAVRRLRDGRGLDVGGLPARRLGGARQPRRRSSTSTASARRARRCSAGTSTATCAAIEAFGWKAIAIDGHDVEAIEAAYAEAEATTGPADRDRRPDQEGQGRQGGRGPARQARQAARRPRGGDRGARRRARPDRRRGRARRRASRTSSRPPAASCRPTSSATRSRRARPTASRSPRWRTIRGDVVALDGEVSNSTHSEDFREAHPDRYFEMFIAEQQLVAAAVGMQVRGWTPFVSTFAAFLSRAYDFVRMAAISRAKLRAVAARTPASRSARTARRRWRWRTSRRSARSTARPSCTRATPTRPRSSSPRWPTATGISFIRTLRGKTPVRTAPDEDVRDRRLPDRPRGRRRRDHRLRHHARRGGQGRRAARRATASTRACSTPTRSSRSTPRPSAPRRASAARSSPSRTTGPRAASATRCSRRSPTATTRARGQARGARDAGAPARPRSCCTARRSTPTRSPTPRRSWSGARA